MNETDHRRTEERALQRSTGMLFVIYMLCIQTLKILQSRQEEREQVEKLQNKSKKNDEVHLRLRYVITFS